MAKKSVEFIDFYQVLDVAPEATEKELLKAYRKKALKCHPDKNPDNPKAAEQFVALTRALEVLTDSTARSAFDKVLKSRKAAELRRSKHDKERKRLREDLEARERAFANQDLTSRQATEEERLATAIDRLRKEGSRLVEEQERLLQEELRQNTREEKTECVVPRLKVRWRCAKDDPTNGGYSSQLLEGIFSKYGPVVGVVVSGKKKGSALVEMSSVQSAARAVREEQGLAGNPLKVTWVQPPPGDVPPSNPPAHNVTGGAPLTSPLTSSHDYESVVMMKMRQAEERRRLIEEMEEQDKNDA